MIFASSFSFVLYEWVALITSLNHQVIDFRAQLRLLLHILRGLLAFNRPDLFLETCSLARGEQSDISLWSEISKFLLRLDDLDEVQRLAQGSQLGAALEFVSEILLTQTGLELLTLVVEAGVVQEGEGNDDLPVD